MKLSQVFAVYLALLEGISLAGAHCSCWFALLLLVRIALAAPALVASTTNTNYPGFVNNNASNASLAKRLLEQGRTAQMYGSGDCGAGWRRQQSDFHCGEQCYEIPETHSIWLERETWLFNPWAPTAKCFENTDCTGLEQDAVVRSFHKTSCTSYTGDGAGWRSCRLFYNC